MSIIHLDQNHVLKAMHFFNQNIKSYDLDYKVLDINAFNEAFFTLNSVYKTITFLYMLDDQIVGFISGTFMFNQNVSYLTFILVDKDHQHKRYAQKLLFELESHFIKINKNLERIDLVFFNPVHLRWQIPNKEHVEHPNAPGVDINSSSYEFFKKHGYIDYALQNVYYRSLDSYRHTSKTLNTLISLGSQDITITFYNKNKHVGFEALFSNLKSNSWEQEINKAIKNDLPILIAAKQNLIIGFAGPLYVEKNMRGYFAGIGIESSYRGLGLGTVLFSSLCENLKLLGANYMTLFTGDQNPARKIYESHGFVIVKSWMNLRKLIKK